MMTMFLAIAVAIDFTIDLDDGQDTYLPPELAALRKLTVDLLARANEVRRRGGEI